MGLTYRKTWIGASYLDDLRESGQHWIYATWHNNTLINAYLLQGQDLVSMVSSSNDGRLAARLLSLMGNKTISGSTTRGGAKVLLSMIKAIQSGNNGAITPDGPRGPRYHLQPGIIVIAQKTGVPLVPLHVEATRQWVFEKSWDHHKLPKPFSRLVISIGKPFQVPATLSTMDLEHYRHRFENVMLANMKQASSHVKIIKERK
jgi:lysophospholipid acyltransferase (LPLAT)-like uncharacterized protein